MADQNLTQTEPNWEVLPLSPDNAKKAYTRPMLGSELLYDQLTVLLDGYVECCMGLTISTTLPTAEVTSRFKDALLRLRFYSPIMGAIPQRGIHDPELRSWVYTPITNAQDAKNWVNDALVVVQDPIEPSLFIQSLAAKKLPYVLPDGRIQYLRAYLARPSAASNEFAMFFHGTHSFVDAKTTLNIFNLVLDYMTNPQSTELPWGTEHENLPPGPITACGGLRDDWKVMGPPLIKKVLGILNEKPMSHFAPFVSTVIKIPGRVHRATMEFTEEETKKILGSLKAAGYTITHLLEAAVALATFNLNPVPEEEKATANVTYSAGIITLTGRMIPQYDTKSRFMSSSVFVPVRIGWDRLYPLKGKARLIEAMAQSKEHYTAYLANSCILHLSGMLMRIAPLRDMESFGKLPTATVNNIGSIEHLLPVTWSPPGDADKLPLFNVTKLHVSHRISVKEPMVHGWTMNSRFTLLMQVADNWEESTLQAFFNEIARQIILVTEAS